MDPENMSSLIKCPYCNRHVVCKEDLQIHLRVHLKNENMKWNQNSNGQEWGPSESLPFLKKLCMFRGYVEQEGYTYWLSGNQKWLYRKPSYTNF